MLVLTRRVGEEIVIGDEIRVTLLAVQGDKVRLGMEAPPTVQIDREEVRDRRLAGLQKEDVVPVAQPVRS